MRAIHAVVLRNWRLKPRLGGRWPQNLPARVGGRDTSHPYNGRLDVLGSRGLRVLAGVYLVVMLLIPLGILLANGLQAGLGGLWRSIAQPIAWQAILLTLWTTALMTGINAVMGTLIAFVLVRYSFQGKALLNALIDLPLAIPTLVTGVMFVVLYGPQTALGQGLAHSLGLQVIFAPPAIVLVLLFITLPLFVRAVEPALEHLEPDIEAAAATLGAGSWTTFRRIILPAITPALISGALLGFARGVGEFGAIVLVAGNIPFHTETAAVYVLGEIEAGDQVGASAVSLVLLAVALALVFVVNLLQGQGSRAVGFPYRDGTTGRQEARHE